MMSNQSNFFAEKYDVFSLPASIESANANYPETHSYIIHTMQSMLTRMGSEEVVQIPHAYVICGKVDGLGHRRWLGNQEIIRVASVCSLYSIVYK